MLKIGPHEIAVPVAVAPMAGMTDMPFREICREMGAGYAVGEMTASKAELRDTKKSQTRWACEGESGLKVVQLLGADPAMMADAARYAADSGADVVDINMGCPAKKVLQAACGSALMRDEALVARILEAVTAASPVPVTLKIRTGWDGEHRNAVEIARIAEAAGIALLTVHGRTREQRFTGHAEYKTIARVKAAVSIPVIANGDIDSGARAKAVLEATGCDGVMVGRASYGNPWIFSEAAFALGYRDYFEAPCLAERERVVLEHLDRHVDFYGESELRQFRKHLRHYLAPVPGSGVFLESALLAVGYGALRRAIEEWFARIKREENR